MVHAWYDRLENILFEIGPLSHLLDRIAPHLIKLLSQLLQLDIHGELSVTCHLGYDLRVFILMIACLQLLRLMRNHGFCTSNARLNPLDLTHDFLL